MDGDGNTVTCHSPPQITHAHLNRSRHTPMDPVSPMTSIMRDLDLRRKANREFEKKVNNGHYDLGRQFALSEFPDNSKVCTRLRVAQLLRDGGAHHHQDQENAPPPASA